METLSSAPDRVVFGAGAERSVADLLRELGAQRVLLVAQQRHTDGAERIARELGDRAVGLFVTEKPQVPAEVADAAVERARATNADWVLAHGGGTPIGVAKAIALQLPVKIAAVPTTYAGSERTDIWGIVRDGRKTTGRSPQVRASLVVYDPSLTLGLDRALSLDSLSNALAHSLEALYATNVTDDACAAAEESLALITSAMRAIAADPSDVEGRTRAMRGAALASNALGSANMGLHHKLAHVLGGSFDTPHARTHAVLLPYTIGFNAGASPRLMRAARDAWQTDDPPSFLYDLQRACGMETSLRGLGLDEAMLQTLTDEVLTATYPNPRPVDRASLHEMLFDALHDRRPSITTRRIAMPAGALGRHALPRVSVRGAPLEEARVIFVALHGRGASGDRLMGDLERRLGSCEGVAFVAPQARDNLWYPKGVLAPVEENQPSLDSALSVVQALWDHLARVAPQARVIPAGFSQGASLVATWLTWTSSRPQRALLFTGVPAPLRDAAWTAPAGMKIHLSCAEADPWIARDAVEKAAERFRAAGATVDLHVVPGNNHAIHSVDEEALRAEASGPTLRE